MSELIVEDSFVNTFHIDPDVGFYQTYLKFFLALHLLINLWNAN